MTWVIIILLASSAFAQEPKRSAKTVRDFRKDNPCPATGKTDGACPGWVVDHVWSLCLGGPDVIANMRWQPADESYKKDIIERQMCAMKAKLENAKPQGRKSDAPGNTSN